jgi:hypothetical protein
MLKTAAKSQERRRTLHMRHESQLQGIGEELRRFSDGLNMIEQERNTVENSIIEAVKTQAKRTLTNGAVT